MGIQILTYIDGKDCRGNSDGKSIAAVAMALAASDTSTGGRGPGEEPPEDSGILAFLACFSDNGGPGENEGKGKARITHVDFRTKQVVSDQEFTVTSTAPTPLSTAGKPARGERRDYANILAAARKLKCYLSVPAHQAALLEDKDGTGIEVDEDHIAGALYDLDHLIEEVTRASRDGLCYRLTWSH